MKIDGKCFICNDKTITEYGLQDIYVDLCKIGSINPCIHPYSEFLVKCSRPDGNDVGYVRDNKWNTYNIKPIISENHCYTFKYEETNYCTITVNAPNETAARAVIDDIMIEIPDALYDELEFEDSSCRLIRMEEHAQ